MYVTIHTTHSHTHIYIYSPKSNVSSFTKAPIQEVSEKLQPDFASVWTEGSVQKRGFNSLNQADL